MEPNITSGSSGRKKPPLLIPSPLALPPAPLPSDRSRRALLSPTPPVSPSDILLQSPRLRARARPPLSRRVTSADPRPNMGAPSEKPKVPCPLASLPPPVDSEMEAFDQPVGPPSYEQSKEDFQTDEALEDGYEAVRNEDGAGAAGRFGRWGGWVEKRAVERITEDEDRQRRRDARRQIDSTTRPPSYDSTVSTILNVPLDFPTPKPLQLPPQSIPLALPVALGTNLPPTDLSRIDYGSRFIPHSSSTVTCVLALPGGLTLLGTATGMRVLVDSHETATRGVWTGLPVWDMSVLKYTPGEGNTPRGSVLVLCGGTEDGTTGRPKKDAEARVWKLESLSSLAQWAAVQNDFEGLDLSQKKGKGKGIAGSFRTMSMSSSTAASSSRQALAQNLSEPSGMDIAQRWAADFSLLPVGAGQSVTAFTVHITESEMSLALATPNSIVLHQGRATPTGSYALSPARTFYIPFPPTSVSIVEMEIPGSVADIADTSSSLFEWDDAASEMSLGEGVLGDTLGIFVAFSGARGCVIRTSDSGVVELKKGGRGEWMPVHKIRLSSGEINIFTRGTASFLFSAPLTIPLAMQIPITEITWPELPASLHVTTNVKGALRLMGLTASGTLHIIDVYATERGIEKDWSSVNGSLGARPRFLTGRSDERGGIPVGYKHAEKDWRIASLVEVDTQQ